MRSRAKLAFSGINCYIAERDYQLGKSLPDKVAANIDRCDCFIAFWTSGGAHSEWVNQEIGYARARKKLIIPVVEKGLATRGFLEGLEYLQFDRLNQTEALNILGKYLSKLKAKKEQEQQLAVAFVAAVIILIILSSGGPGEGPLPPRRQLSV